MIKKIIIICLILHNTIYALDATMEITKSKSSLPVINIEVASSDVSKELTNSLVLLIKKDLDVSGHFYNSDKTITKQGEFKLNYKYLRSKKIDLHLLLYIKVDNEGKMIVNSMLYDVNKEMNVLNKQYAVGTNTRYPFLSHGIAIDINKYLNAPTIDWMNRFVIFSRYIDSKTSEIVISDYTLTYQKIIVKGGLNIFPKWANKIQDSFYYTTYRYQTPTLMKAELYTNKENKIISSDGMVVCSDVSKDGNKLVLTMAPNSQPDIYVYNLTTKIKTRITKYGGIDVGGSFVENEKKIVFISDRLKHPNIFAKTIGKRGVERLVYHGRNNSQCTTYGKYVVYSSRETNNEFSTKTFNLYLMSMHSDYIKRLTAKGINQFPKFSIDGESILFIKNDKKSYLGIIRINHEKSFLFGLKSGKLQSIDW